MDCKLITRQYLKDIVKYETCIYKNDVIVSNTMFDAKIKKEPQYRIWKWQRCSRHCDYFRSQMYHRKGLFRIIAKLMYVYYIRMKHKLGESLGLEISTENIGKGLIVYHFNNVVNTCAIIGENCHLHGTNVIGNIGPDDPTGCPTIGNNVMLGAGAKVLGRVTIADNIKIAAGAVVVHSFTEPGITIAGVPARKVSK